MPNEELTTQLNVITDQFNTLQELVKSSFGPHCDQCGRNMMEEGWLILGSKKVCGPCMDHK